MIIGDKLRHSVLIMLKKIVVISFIPQIYPQIIYRTHHNNDSSASTNAQAIHPPRGDANNLAMVILGMILSQGGGGCRGIPWITFPCDNAGAFSHTRRVPEQIVYIGR